MSRNQTIEEFLRTYVAEPQMWLFLGNLLLAGALSFLLGLFYVRYGRSLSNRRTLARNFLLIGMTTMLVISVVKTSLALSLGMVGALSIVRFRTAIKEPEELAYLFMALVIGVALGAGQWRITLVAFFVILGVLWIRALFREREGGGNLFLTVASATGALRLPDLVGTLEPCCSTLRLKRFDESGEAIEALFEVGFDDYAQLEQATRALRSRHESVRVSFLDGD